MSNNFNTNRLKTGDYIFLEITYLICCFFLRVTNILKQSDLLYFITSWLHNLISAHPQIYIGYKYSFLCRNEQFFARSRRSRNYAEAYKWYAAQVIPQTDAEIAEKGHFWMETSQRLDC